MRKLLILALIAVAALVVMGETGHFSGGHDDAWVSASGDGQLDSNGAGFLTGSVEVHVCQWLTATVTINDVATVTDYGNAEESVVGDLEIDSNANVKVEATVTDWGDLDTSEIDSFVIKLDNTQVSDVDPQTFSNGTYDIKLEITAGDNLDAGSYTITIKFTFYPTVTF